MLVSHKTLEGCAALSINLDVPLNEPRKKIQECMAGIASKWATLTPHERSEITLEKVKALSLARENREVGRHNVPLAAFHDTRLTYTDVVEAVSKQLNFSCSLILMLKLQLAKLNGRTGDESLLVLVRSDSTHFNAPLVYRTGERVDEFCNLGLKASSEDIGIRMEGYMISGVSGE